MKRRKKHVAFGQASIKIKTVTASEIPVLLRHLLLCWGNLTQVQALGRQVRCEGAQNALRIEGQATLPK